MWGNQCLHCLSVLFEGEKGPTFTAYLMDKFEEFFTVHVLPAATWRHFGMSSCKPVLCVAPSSVRCTKGVRDQHPAKPIESPAQARNRAVQILMESLKGIT